MGMRKKIKILLRKERALSKIKRDQAKYKRSLKPIKRARAQ